MSDFELVWDTRCLVAESPVWDAAARRLLFADIMGKRINVMMVDDGARTWWELPDIVASFGLCRSGRVVVALRHRVVLYDPRNGVVEDLTDPVDEPPTNRLNDGKVGPDGCFWVGSMDERPDRQPVGALYRVTPDGRIEKKAQGYCTSNGLAWSPDGATMYHSDTRPGIIEAWDFDRATGGLAGHRVLAILTNEQGRPDGAATAADGSYWVAGPSAGCINRFAPQGKLLETLDFPVPGPTMPCFADGQMYVTSLRDGKPPETLERFPGLGGLFRMTTSVAGAPVGLFADS
jgi:sugar lactone lactonase YvrE